MRKTNVSFFLLLPLLLACQGKKPNLKDLDKEYQLFKNGDLMSLDFSNSGYKNISNSVSASDLIAEMELGNSVTFLYGQDKCQSCLDFIGTYRSFISEHLLDVTYLSSNEAGTAAEKSLLSEYFGEKIEKSPDRPFLNRTPTWYYASKEGCKILNWGSDNERRLTLNFKRNGSIVDVYRFSSLTTIKNALEKQDALVYVYDIRNSDNKSFFQENIQEQSKKSEKPTYLLDIGRMDKNEISLIPKFFHSKEDGHHFIKYGDKIASLEQKSEAKAIADSYYAA